MNFERNLDIKEALKLGRLANATIVKGYALKGVVQTGKGELISHMYSTSDKVGTRLILESLEKIGKIEKGIIKKLFTESALKMLERKLIPVDLDLFGIHIRNRDIYLSIRTEYNPRKGNILNVEINEFGHKNLSFEGKLYVMNYE